MISLMRIRLKAGTAVNDKAYFRSNANHEGELHTMATQHEKAETFRALHAADSTFVIPNPWDAGTAAVLAGLGFKALATTSSGLAFVLGRADGTRAVTREDALANARDIVNATDLPVNGDLENCYADDPEEAAATIAMAAEAGLVGCSIEDYSGDANTGIYDFELSVNRVRAAVAAARALPFPFTLTARAENLIRGRDDLDDTIRRLQAFEEAGADVLYAPGLNDVDSIRAVTSSVSKPVNALATPANTHLTLADYAAAGARRVSLGGTLARVASGAFLRSAREIAEHGTFTSGQGAGSMGELNALLEQGAGR